MGSGEKEELLNKPLRCPPCPPYPLMLPQGQQRHQRPKTGIRQSG